MNASDQPNATMLKFGFPESLVRDYVHWVVLLRPQQATLGSLVLVCKDSAMAFSEISPGAFAELQQVTADIETGLGAFRPFQKINYLMLMMVDKDVHFHVLPRYQSDQTFEGAVFPDKGWPAVPDLGSGAVLDQAEIASIGAAVRAAWPAGSD